MAVLFGLWHLQPVIASTRGGAGKVAGEATGTFAFTTVAGVAFGWLRLRSSSLLAPALLHVGTNSAALVTAWYATH
jgi:membrane protease YdiL (CAAX protease family)